MKPSARARHPADRRPPCARPVPRRAETGPGKTTPVELLRVRHRMQALVCLRDMGPLSRVELCRQLGQSTTTMTKVIGELLALGWVTEGGPRPSRDVGRPRTMLLLAAGASNILVLSVEPDRIGSARVGLDLVPQDLAAQRYSDGIGAGAGAVSRIASFAAAETARHVARGRRIDGIAVVAPGMTDTGLRVSRYAQQLGWRHLDIAGPVEARTGLPTILCNNTRCMALAEFRNLRLAAGTPMLFVQARYGLGAALVDSVAPGAASHLGASELGQIPLGINGFADRVPADRQLMSVLKEAYLRAVLRDDDAAPIVRRLEAARTTPDGARLYVQTVDNLAAAIGVAVNLLNPAVIVVGGIYAEGSDAFLAELRGRLDAHAEPELLAEIGVQRTACGAAGAFAGGALLAFDRLLRQPATYQPSAQAA